MDGKRATCASALAAPEAHTLARVRPRHTSTVPSFLLERAHHQHTLPTMALRRGLGLVPRLLSSASTTAAEALATPVCCSSQNWALHGTSGREERQEGAWSFSRSEQQQDRVFCGLRARSLSLWRALAAHRTLTPRATRTTPQALRPTWPWPSRPAACRRATSSRARRRTTSCEQLSRALLLRCCANGA